MSAQPRIKTRWTVEEYLAAERASETKSEYIDGMIYDMTGASEAHNLITMQAGSQFVVQLKGRGCKTYPSDMRLKTPSGLYAYPDVMVVCGASDILKDGHKDTLLNPTLIIEVLSPSTELYDRNAKFKHYKSIPSLREYLLIAQDEPRIERLRFQSANDWLYSDFSGIDSVCELASIGCTLKLADVYEQVTFVSPE